MTRALALTLALLTTTATARAQIDARVHDAYRELAATGATTPWFKRARDVEASGELPLLLRLSRPLSSGELASLRARRGRIDAPLVTGATPATMSRGAFDWLAGRGVVARASVDLAPPVVARPLRVAAELGGVSGARPAFRAATGEALSGKGIVVGDIDTSADVFHPAFFRPLPPTPWVDVDGDGALTPGRDGYDLDHDGVVSAREILRQLPGRARGLFSAQIVDGTGDERFDPGWDYLYLDENGDGRRNVGAEIDDADARPAMAEATFVADDVDGDGSIRQPERLWRLGESKFRAVSHKGKIYRRGVDLSTFTPSIDHPDDAAHATAVLGTIAGGQAGVSRYLGFAYDADLLLVTSQWDTISLTAKLDWLVAEGANVVVTELGVWGYEVSDGSTELETAIDAAVTKGALVVSPSGNLGVSQKHAFAEIPSDVDYVNEALDLGSDASRVWASVTWREGQQPIAARAIVDGQDLDLGADGSHKLGGGRVLKAVHGVTSKGSGYLLVSLSRGNAPELPKSVELRLRSLGGQPLHASLFVLDDVSSWDGGWTWKESTTAGTMCPPSLAAKTLAVGAAALHVGPGYYPDDATEPLALRGFSGRGPDLFGDPGVDVVAPDNAIAAYPDAYELGTTRGEGVEAPLAEFGGTSGAGPEVAGVAALMFQAHPGESATEIRARLLAAARSDGPLAGLGEAERGRGRATLGLPVVASRPRVSLLAPARARSGAPVTVTAQVSDAPAGGLIARWDVGADGQLDDETRTLTRALTQPDGPLDVLVEVTDAQGGSARATVRVALDTSPRAPLVEPPRIASEGAAPPVEATGGQCGAARGVGTEHGALALSVTLGLGLALARRRRSS